MRYTLLESAARGERRTAGTVVSVVVHAGVIALAAAGTARATARPAAPELPTRVVYAAPQPAAPSSPAHPVVDRVPSDRWAILTRIRPPQTIPVGIPREMPGIDVSRALDRTHLFDGPPSGATLAGTGTGDVLGGPADGIWTEARVDKAVVGRPGNPAPQYPEALRAARVEGVVIARFVVDSSGRVEAGSIRLVDATQARFADAVRSALLASRYYPAEVGGRRVRQLVEQRFAFQLVP